MTTLLTINLARDKDARAQRTVFETYGKKMYAVARRYLSDQAKTEDAVAESFIIIFEKMTDCHFIAVPAFEIWIRRIVINECLKVLRKEKLFDRFIDVDHDDYSVDEECVEQLTAEQILQIISEMPVGYRTVFNLYAIEGYTHAEIGEMLNISVGASKSQLSKAKNMLQRQIIELDPYYAVRKTS